MGDVNSDSKEKKRTRARLLGEARHWGDVMLSMLYPRRCPGCGSDILPGVPGTFCNRCAAEIRYITEDRCPKCGNQLGPHVGENRKACPSCKSGFAFRRAVAVWRYDGPGRDAVVRWKYGGALDCEKVFVDRVVDLLQGEDFLDELEVVAAVPMHWRRRAARKFNQAELLARGVARKLNLPYARRAITRIRNTPSQVKLSAVERRQNVRGAFRSKKHKKIAGKVVLLIDDVVTTCATVDECSRALRAAGAKRVYVASVGR